MGVIRMTRAFLPALRKSGDARIVNLSSIFGIISPPGQTAYTTSKFAVRGFSNALREELRGTGLGVTVVHPGGVATNIARSAPPPAESRRKTKRARRRCEKALRMPPEQAGEIIVQGIERRADRVIVGNDARFIALLERLAPVVHCVAPIARDSKSVARQKNLLPNRPALAYDAPQSHTYLHEGVSMHYVNWLAILACGAASMVLGFLWYSPALFAKPWTREMGYDINDKEKMAEMRKSAGPAYTASLIAAILSAFVLALFFHWMWKPSCRECCSRFTCGSASLPPCSSPTLSS